MSLKYKFIKPHLDFTSKKDIFNIWLIHKNGKILIKDFDRAGKSIKADDLTISANTTNQVLEQIEEEWRILSSISNLEKIYEFKENNNSSLIHTYLLELDLNDELELFIQDRSRSSFVFYNDLQRYLNNANFNNALKEELGKVFEIMDERYFAKVPEFEYIESLSLL